jgi:dienelactone hydrolase
MIKVERQHITLFSQGQMVSAFLHRPSTPHPQSPISNPPSLPAVLMLHGLMAAKTQPPHRLFVKLADELARRGILSLRIDFRGRGDSEGDSIDVTPSADYNDAHVALDYLTAHPQVDPTRLGLVGISWGGTIAALLAGRNPHVKTTVIWSNAPAGPLQWHPPFEQVEGQEATYLWGNWLGRPFYEELWQLDTLAQLKQTQGSLLLVYGTADEAVPAEALQTAANELQAAAVPHELVAIEGADHVFMRYDWERHLLQTTVEWLSQKL